MRRVFGKFRKPRTNPNNRLTFNTLGLDTILLHGYVDLDALLRHRRPVPFKREDHQASLLPSSSLADSASSDFSRTLLALFPRARVKNLVGFPILFTKKNYCFCSCHTSSSLSEAVKRILPNYCATYLPIALVMIANPCLYKASSKEMQSVIITTSGQFTTRERNIIDAIETKFSIINLIFYACWLPNLINGILLWTLWFHLPVQIIMVLWYIMVNNTNGNKISSLMI